MFSKPLLAKNLRMPAGVLLAAIASDQATKAAAAAILAEGDAVSLLGGMAVLTFVRNHEGFLGIVRGLPEPLQVLFLYVCVAVLLAGCLYMLFIRRPLHRQFALPLSLATGGGLSNLTDRLLHGGGVGDFLMLSAGTVHTGIFNLADVYILLGSFLLGYQLFAGPRE